MYTPALMAFLHHLAAFTVVGALVAEVVLFKPPLTVRVRLSPHEEEGSQSVNSQLVAAWARDE